MRSLLLNLECTLPYHLMRNPATVAHQYPASRKRMLSWPLKVKWAPLSNIELSRPLLNLKIKLWVCTTITCTNTTTKPQLLNLQILQLASNSVTQVLQQATNQVKPQVLLNLKEITNDAVTSNSSLITLSTSRGKVADRPSLIISPLSRFTITTIWSEVTTSNLQEQEVKDLFNPTFCINRPLSKFLHITTYNLLTAPLNRPTPWSSKISSFLKLVIKEANKALISKTSAEPKLHHLEERLQETQQLVLQLHRAMLTPKQLNLSSKLALRAQQPQQPTTFSP